MVKINGRKIARGGIKLIANVATDCFVAGVVALAVPTGFICPPVGVAMAAGAALVAGAIDEKLVQPFTDELIDSACEAAKNTKDRIKNDVSVLREKEEKTE